MFITIVSGKNVSSLEVSPDLEFENFIALCCIELPDLASVSYSDLRFIINGIIITPKQEIFQKTIEVFFFINIYNLKINYFSRLA